MNYCDGLDPKYLLVHGASGLAPLSSAEGTEPLLLERRSYLPAFALKRSQDADMKAAIARVMGRRHLESQVAVTAVVDSGEGSERAVASLGDQSGLRLDVIPCDSALSPGEARNRAAASSSGEILAFLPANSQLAPSALARCIEYLANNPAISLVVTGEECTTDFQSLLKGQFIGTPLISRRQAFEDSGGFNNKLIECLDWDFQLAAAAAGHLGAKALEPSSVHWGRHVSQEHPEFVQVVRRTPDIFRRDTARIHSVS